MRIKFVDLSQSIFAGTKKTQGPAAGGENRRGENRHAMESRAGRGQTGRSSALDWLTSAERGTRNAECKAGNWHASIAPAANEHLLEYHAPQDHRQAHKRIHGTPPKKHGIVVKRSYSLYAPTDRNLRRIPENLSRYVLAAHDR
jgi:hypothetical protein